MGAPTSANLRIQESLLRSPDRRLSCRDHRRGGGEMAGSCLQSSPASSGNSPPLWAEASSRVKSEGPGWRGWAGDWMSEI